MKLLYHVEPRIAQIKALIFLRKIKTEFYYQEKKHFESFSQHLKMEMKSLLFC